MRGSGVKEIWRSGVWGEEIWRTRVWGEGDLEVSGLG